MYDIKLKDIKDIKELLIEYRDILPDIDISNTFGIEIEYDNLKGYNVIDNMEFKGLFNFYKFKYNLQDWIIKDELDLPVGGEINSKHLINSVKDFKELLDVCIFTDKYVNVNQQCGGHIHIGKQILKDKASYYKNLINIWSSFEHVIYRFLYGEYISYRPIIVSSASSTKSDYMVLYNDIKYQSYPTYKDILKVINKRVNTNRNQGINFRTMIYKDKKDTIEVRCPNGTLDPVIWQNNINFLLHLFSYCTSYSFDEELVNYVREKSKDINNITMYNKIYIEDAIILANLIFKEEIDKIYFLRGYIKDGQESNEYVKSSCFTRKYN